MEWKYLEKNLMGCYKITDDYNKASLIAVEYTDDNVDELNRLISLNNVKYQQANKDNDLEQKNVVLSEENAKLKAKIAELEAAQHEWVLGDIKAKKAVEEADQRLADGERLRESLIRMTRERANKERHLDSPKKHNGYVLQFVQSQSTISKGNQYQTWQITLETPYLMVAGDVVLNIVLRDLLDHQQTAPSLLELMEVKYENKSDVKSIRDLTNNHSRLPDYERHYSDANYCYNIGFKGSAKGYWQVVLSCTKLPALGAFTDTVQEDNLIE